MSQNDFVIANAAGAAVRSDMNSAFQALASLSGGTSAPGTIYPNQLWFDTTNDLLKIRDEANTAWITIASLVGTTWVPYWSGTAMGNMSTLTYSAVAQALIMSARQIETTKASVASATTPNLSTAAANAIELTGTTTITGFTTGQAGTLYYVEYTGAGLTLTHNATSLICPTAASIAVATGDTFFIFSRGSNNVRILGYQRADGSALGGAVASQSQMEAASSNVVSVSPGRFHFHPASPKGWARIDGTGTVTLITSYNTTSVSDNGVGDYSANWTTALSTATYPVFPSTEGTGGTGAVRINAVATGSARVQNFNSASGGGIDVDPCCVLAVGDI